MKTLFGIAMGYFVYTKSGREVLKNVSGRAMEVVKTKISDPDIKTILFGKNDEKK